MTRGEELSEKCEVCDGPYCPVDRCGGKDGYVWIAGRGWYSPNVARAAQRLNPTLDVRWDDVWTSERYEDTIGVVIL